MSIQEYLAKQLEEVTKAITERINELQKTDPTLISLIASHTTLTALRNSIQAGEALKEV